jgi:outer membrane protein assembly factor BamB
MSRRLFPAFLAAALCGAFSPCGQLYAAPSALIAETTAARHGLTRPWFTQVTLAEGQARLCELALQDDTLYAVTDRAVIHAIDAKTGQTLWWKQVGDSQQLTLTPSANRNLVAVINGSHLYALNRATGEILYQQDLDGAPGAGPALGRMRAYVPMNMGKLLAYRLESLPDESDKADATEKNQTPATPDHQQDLRLSQRRIAPLSCQSYGKALVQPLVIRAGAPDESVVWPTDRGHLNLAALSGQSEDYIALKYRLETDAAIVGQPAYLPPDPAVADDSGVLVTASRDGTVYAVAEQKGEWLWQFSIGEPISEPPALIEDHVYVTMELGGMYCLETKTGKNLWFAPGVFRFVAASKARIYAADQVGRLLVLNAQNGAHLDTIPLDGVTIRLFNLDTDRIYLADEGGLIQCLHEVELGEPLVHAKDRKEAAAKAKEKPVIEQEGIGEPKKPAKK